MSFIEDAIEDYEKKREYINDCIEELRQKVYDITYNHNFPNIDCMIPQPEENLDIFELYNDQVFTKWSYIDGYEALGDRHTTWHIPVEWFSFSSDEIKQCLLNIEESENQKLLNQQIYRLKVDAEELGFELVEKSQ